MRRQFLLVVVFVAASLLPATRGKAQEAQATAGAESDAHADDEKSASHEPPADSAKPSSDSSSPAAEKQAAADPNGAWRWERTFQDNTATFIVRLDWTDKKLTGKYSAFGSTTDVEEGRFEKNEVSFVARREFNGNHFEVRFKGKIDGDEIRGTTNVDFGNGPQDFEWAAKRTVELEDVLGVWKLRIESPQGVIEPQITITRERDKLHGAYESPFGKRDAKELKLKDGVLSWEISGDLGGNPFKVSYAGKPRGNAIAGKSEFDFGGNAGEAQFTGKRTPASDDLRASAKSADADSPSDKPSGRAKRPPLEEDSTAN